MPLTTAPESDRPDPLAARLHLVQWLSPAFPLGSFAWSQGLETAISEGLLCDGPDVARWLADVISRGSGRNDALLLALALAPEADHAALDRLARALAPGRERLAETLEQGRALGLALAGIEEAPPPAAMALPIALGQACARRFSPMAPPLAPEEIVALYLHALAQALVLAAVRFMPLGQTEGQRILTGLQPVLIGTAREAVARAGTEGTEALATAAFGADLAQMRHEGLEVRIFRS